MSFFKKVLSRSRSNSRSDNYVDDDYDRPDSSGGQGQNQPHYDPNRPPSSWKYDQQQQYHGAPAPQQQDAYGSNTRGLNNQQSDNRMYNQNSQQPTSYRSPTERNSATSRSSHDGFVDVPSMSQQLPANVTNTQMPQKVQHSAAPDLLTQAFNEAIRPYAEKIDGLEGQIADLQAFVDTLEQQRLDIFAWIDKRGLRPDLPPNLSKQIDTVPGPNNTTGAEILNSQLDRKITIVNFDLHRLQDDLNDSISSAHFASSMIKFLPDIRRLASLPGGPRYAYDLIIKLVGNLNSHGGVDRDSSSTVTDEEIEEDRRARTEFGERMDDELIEVVRQRQLDGEQWDAQKEVRRFEKNGAYLKNLGFDDYFPRTLETLRRVVQGQQANGGGAQASQGGQGGNGAGMNRQSMNGMAGTSQGHGQDMSSSSNQGMGSMPLSSQMQSANAPIQEGRFQGPMPMREQDQQYGGGGNPNSIAVGGMRGDNGGSVTPPRYLK